MLPEYSQISQTISELGENNSPFESIFRVITLVDAMLLLVFALGLFFYSAREKLSLFPSVLIGFYGLMELGIGVYPAPHPWHNLFGIYSTPGFFAPLALAITWKTASDLQVLRRLSAAAFAVILVAMLVNLSPIIHPYPFIMEYYGVFQRLLFFPFYLWMAILAAMLMLRRGEAQPAEFR
jgi:hypothetical membrane protein